MSGERNEQAETAVLMDDKAFGVNIEVPYMDECPPAETCNASEELAASESSQSWPGFLLRILAIFSCCSGDNKSVTVPRTAGNLINEIEEFIPGIRRYLKNILGRELPADVEIDHRRLYPAWNTFLQQVQGIPGTSAIISSDINGDTDGFIPWWEERGAQLTKDNKAWSKRWLARWNMCLQAQAGETLVTRCSVCLTIVGFIFYIVDLGSDIGTAIYFLHNGQWWQAIGTFIFVYAGVIFYTGWKWSGGEIPYTGAAARLRYVASLLVNWPDVQQYGALCLLEWKVCKSLAGRAHVVLEWHERRVRVAFLKFTEGVWEACPQAMLQLCLLVPDLYGDWTWTEYLRIASVSVSLCTAGAALVNREKCRRIIKYTDVPLSELVVLYVWAGAVTVARLVSLALLLTVHPYWALAGVALHLVLYDVYWCRTKGGPRTLAGVVDICVDTVRLFISPFTVDGSVTYRRVLHAIHFLGNTAVAVVWALGTPLLCAHPALYTAILCFNATMFAVGVGGWQLHEKKWPRSYFI